MVGLATVGLLLARIMSGVLFGLSWAVLGYMLWIQRRGNQRALVDKL